MTPTPEIREEVTKVLELLPRILSLIAQGKLYPQWTTEFAWKETAKLLDSFTKEVVGKLPWHDLTSAELDALGFGAWSEETGLRLIPIYLYWAIPPATRVTCFDGTTQELSEADTDSRFGCLAFGFVPKDAQTAPRVEDGRLVRAAKEEEIK